MPSETGFWSAEEAAINHDFSENLANWIANYFPKDKTVIDFGAGNGAYIRRLHDVWFADVWALEGDVSTITEISNIIKQDLTLPFLLSKKYNSICLEVGEHLPGEFLQIFIDNICNNTEGKIILSWAIPGQEGYHHVSCRDNIWVINEMEKRGMKLLAEDSLRARVATEERFGYFKNTIMVFEK